MFVLKLCGSASKAGYSFEKIMDLGYAVNANAFTVGSSLDHCHIPGREHHREIPDDVVVLGMVCIEVATLSLPRRESIYAHPLRESTTSQVCTRYHLYQNQRNWYRTC